MARLRVSAEILLQALFPDQDFLMLHDAQFDLQRGVPVLDLSGPDIPNGGEMIAEITVERRATRFVPVHGS